MMKPILLLAFLLSTTSVNAESLAPWNSSYKPRSFYFENKRAVIITTSYATLDKINPDTGEVIEVGKPTGLYPSEMTGPYYEFIDANIDVDIVSIKGGDIPMEPGILNRRVRRSASDSRYLKDNLLQEKVKNSIPLHKINISDYDIVFLAGGWGAAYDFAQSRTLTEKMSQAYAQGKIIGAICHGPLGLLNAKKPDGSSLVKGLKMTAVTDRQVKQLKIQHTPKHPERDLKAAGAVYEGKRHFLRDFLASLVVVDGNIVTGQNQKSDLEAAEKIMELLEKQVQK
jgi:putative intracellular protease/amidase